MSRGLAVAIFAVVAGIVGLLWAISMAVAIHDPSVVFLVRDASLVLFLLGGIALSGRAVVG